MNKRELIDQIAAKVGDDVSKRDVERTVDAFKDVVGASLRDGEPVSLVGFGTFEPRKRSARTARNPQTGESVKVKATTVPAFKAGSALKDYVARKSGAPERFLSLTGTSKSTKKAAKKGATKKGAATKSTAKSTKKAAKKSAKKSAKKVAKRSR